MNSRGQPTARDAVPGWLVAVGVRAHGRIVGGWHAAWQAPGERRREGSYLAATTSSMPTSTSSGSVDMTM